MKTALLIIVAERKPTIHYYSTTVYCPTYCRLSTVLLSTAVLLLYNKYIVLHRKPWETNQRWLHLPQVPSGPSRGAASFPCNSPVGGVRQYRCIHITLISAYNGNHGVNTSDDNYHGRKNEPKNRESQLPGVETSRKKKKIERQRVNSILWRTYPFFTEKIQPGSGSVPFGSGSVPFLVLMIN